MKHFGSPTDTKDLNIVFALFAAILTADILVLINYTYHLFLPTSNFSKFGWPFFFIQFGIPYLSPLIAFIAAFIGSDSLLKTTGNMNALMIQFNIPLTVIASLIYGEDYIYYVVLAFMVFIKICMSAVSAKVRMYLINPRYQRNQIKLQKILFRQLQKTKIRDDILGGDTAQLIDEVQDGSKTWEVSKNPPIDTETLRDKLLE